MPERELKTRGIVVRRTDFGEADRIVQLITPLGKVGVLARGARRERSKLKGGVEMFSEVEIVARRGKGELYILTGTRLIEFYQKLAGDWERLKVAAKCLKKAARAAEQITSGELFEILREVLRGLNGDLGEVSADGVASDAVVALVDGEATAMVVELWFELNLARVIGEQVNLMTDGAGRKLREAEKYEWDMREKVLRKSSRGEIGAVEIKLARLMWAGKLGVVLRVKGVGELARKLTPIARSME